jgi:molybdopterin-binding protein
LTTVGI